MAIDPRVLQSAWLLSPSPAGALPNGLIVQKPGQPIIMKARLQAGDTYVVSTSALPGDLVVLEPNGFPLNPGTALSTYEFVPSQSGTYLILFTANPRYVASGAPINILLHDYGQLTPLTLQQAEDPFSIVNNLGTLINNALGVPKANYVLHQPDGLAGATAAPSQETVLPAVATATPLERGADGRPDTWVGSSDAPGRPGDPTQITLAVAKSNYSGDSTTGVNFTNAVPDSFVPLLAAAAHVWEGLANIHFTGVPDMPAGSVGVPDIRVGVADLQKGVGSPPMQFIGLTHIQPNANDIMSPDTLVSVEDPNETPVTQLADGDFRYQGTDTTVFEDFLHELGHALGLAHNPGDPTSIMNPVLSSRNPLPDAQDVAAIQSLYGPSGGSLTLSSSEVATLDKLVPGFLNV